MEILFLVQDTVDIFKVKISKLPFFSYELNLGYRQLSVGKPFHEAAVEAKKEFVEKRIGSRGELSGS